MWVTWSGEGDREWWKWQPVVGVAGSSGSGRVVGVAGSGGSSNEGWSAQELWQKLQTEHNIYDLKFICGIIKDISCYPPLCPRCISYYPAIPVWSPTPPSRQCWHCLRLCNYWSTAAPVPREPVCSSWPQPLTLSLHPGQYAPTNTVWNIHTFTLNMFNKYIPGGLQCIR